MTLYEKIINNKKILMNILITCDNNDACSFCEYHSYVCMSKFNISCLDGAVEYYDKHKDFFTADIITVNLLAEIIYMSDFRDYFVKLLPVEKPKYRSECVLALADLLESEYEDDLEKYLEV